MGLQKSEAVLCPVGDLVDSPHALDSEIVVVDWSVFGDRRTRVTVCADCAEGVES